MDFKVLMVQAQFFVNLGDQRGKTRLEKCPVVKAKVGQKTR